MSPFYVGMLAGAIALLVVCGVAVMVVFIVSAFAESKRPVKYWK
jgi:VIT1/CCC1 family predicted Fe2+/Mn2+ transporter